MREGGRKGCTCGVPASIPGDRRDWAELGSRRRRGSFLKWDPEAKPPLASVPPWGPGQGMAGGLSRVPTALAVPTLPSSGTNSGPCQRGPMSSATAPGSLQGRMPSLVPSSAGGIRDRLAGERGRNVHPLIPHLLLPALHLGQLLAAPRHTAKLLLGAAVGFSTRCEAGGGRSGLGGVSCTYRSPLPLLTDTQWV